MTEQAIIKPAASGFDPRPYLQLMQQGQFQNVLTILHPQVAAGLADCAMLDLISQCYFGLERPERGIEVLEAIVTTWPDNISAWGKLGARRLQNGNIAEAAEAFEQILSFQPNSVMALTALYVASPYDWNSRYAKRLRKLLAKGRVSQSEKRNIFSALGKISSAEGRTNIAFSYFKAAKDETPGRYNAEAVTASVTGQSQHFDPSHLPHLECDINTAKPVFIVGPPRSGTTLIENMLNAHQGVGTIGESPALMQVRFILTDHRSQEITQHQDEALLFGQHQEKDWHWCRNTSPEQAMAGRKAYLAHHPLQNGTSKPEIIINKLPQNHFEMGFARMILPDARFIFMMRHPLDVGLSLFCTNFHAGHFYSKKLAWIGHYIRASYESLDDYIPKLGSRLHLQSYRQLVEDPEPQMKALLKHVGLEWDPNCLTPQNSKGLVKTASLRQVRAGLNTSGLGKWKQFETQLEPLIESLGGWDWIKEWEARDAAL